MFLGIDCGTQGTKIILLDLEQGKVIAEGKSPHCLDSNDEGKREQHPHIWVDALKKSFGAMVRNYRLDKELREIKAIGVSGQQHGLVVLDKSKEVIRPAKLWCDTETTVENELLIDKLGGREEVLKKIGLEMMTGYTASKLLWLKEKEPHHYQRISYFFLPHDFLNFFLTGEINCEPGDSSGTGYFDVRERKWSREVMTAIDSDRDLSLCLPPLIASDQPLGYLRKDLALAWGLSSSVVVSSGGGDNMMGAIGSGNIQSGIMTMSLGTSGTLYTHSKNPFANISSYDSSHAIANFCSSDGGWLPLVCHMNVTSTVNQVRNLFGLDLYSFFKLAERSPEGANGIILLPFFNGERVPNLPNSQASFHHLNSTNFTRSNLARAALEGASFSLAYGYLLLQKNGIDTEEIRLIGGGAKSDFWCQLMANIMDCPVSILEHDEGSALGAALQSAWVFYGAEKKSLSSICERVIKIKKIFSPQLRSVKSYQEIYKKYERKLIDYY